MTICCFTRDGGGRQVTRARRVPPAAILILLALAWLATPAAGAQQPDDQLPAAAAGTASFLSSRERGQEILMLLHAFTRYQGHELQRGVRIDGPGDASDGRFELIYRFWWEPGDGITDVGFLCNGNGKVYQVQVVYTNAWLNRPFSAAGASIKFIGRQVVEHYQDRLKPWQQTVLASLIDRANAKGLLELVLEVQQGGD
jgi:hypothetical protein